MELRLNPDQVVAIVRKYLDEELHMQHFQIDQMRGIVPRKGNAGLQIELEVSVNPYFARQAKAVTPTPVPEEPEVVEVPEPINVEEPVDETSVDDNQDDLFPTELEEEVEVEDEVIESVPQSIFDAEEDVNTRRIAPATDGDLEL